MSAIINSFLFIFFVAFASDWLIFGFQISHLLIIFLSALATSLICYNLQIIKKDGELSFLYLNLYSLFLKKYFTDFVTMALSLHKPFFVKFELNPTLFEVQIEDHKKINRSILCSAVNMSQGLLVYSIKKDIALIYCLNEYNYTSLNFLRLTKDVKDMNDNSLV